MEGDRVVVQRRQVCTNGERSHYRTVYDAQVVPRRRYSRRVIAAAVSERQAGGSWEESAAVCQAQDRLAVTTVKDWVRNFDVVDGELGMRSNQERAVPRRCRRCKLRGPGGRSPKPSQEDPWERPQRSPP